MITTQLMPPTLGPKYYVTKKDNTNNLVELAEQRGRIRAQCLSDYLPSEAVYVEKSQKRQVAYGRLIAVGFSVSMYLVVAAASLLLNSLLSSRYILFSCALMAASLGGAFGLVHIALWGRWRSKVSRLCLILASAFLIQLGMLFATLSR